MTPFLQEGEHNATIKRPESSSTRPKTSFIYQSKAIDKVMKVALKASTLETSVLIVGGRGTGKKALAQEIHNKSRIRFGPIFSLHCKSLSEKVLETELFGFKGDEITAGSEGAFRKADGGTLILDDASALPLSVQNKLCNYVQTGEITSVGSQVSVPVQTRLILTINKQDEKKDSVFSKQLYDHINPIRIEIPDLEKRREDISDLARYFLNSNVNESKTSSKKIHVTDPAMDALKCYKWPGNVRELRNICERAQIFCRNNKITVNDLPRHILDTSECSVQVKYDPSLKLSDVSRLYILSALKHFPSKKRAAQALGITVKTLYNRLHEYGIFDQYAIHSKD